ncbi:EthD family reductase [Neptuniibacter marinus]|uniref:EthD family reductase n=1 Tax=Neptuniibacter marinus TaxID=1806670 RepID=UPI003B5AC801
MIKVSVMYPNSSDAKFDMDYYNSTHAQLVLDRLGDTLKSFTVDAGIAGGAPGEAPGFIAMGHLVYESVDAFEASFGPHAEELLGDIPNFTNVQPQVQISEIKR